MASDSQDSRRKHRRTSSDDEDHDDSIGDSKRHKHRHHHRHKHRHHHHKHRHGHRHSSKKRDEEMKDEIAIDRKEEEVEEGEILEDEERISETKKVDSDVESGEVKDDSYTSPADNKKSSKYTKLTGSDRSDGSKKHGSQHHRDEVSMSENVVNGDFRDRSRKDESRSCRRSKSPSKRSSKEKDLRESGIRQQSVDLMDVDEDVYSDRRNLLSPKVSENRDKASSRSPSHSRCHMEISDRSRSVSPDRMRGRERSQSISKSRLDHERDDVLYGNGKVRHELEDERDSRRSTDYRLDGRDIIKDKGRERSSSYHRSSMDRRKDEGGESWDREREKLHRDKRRVKEHEISRERYERDDDRDRNSDKARDRSRGRDRREREPDKERSKAIETRSDMDWDRERDRERRRDKDRGRSRDRELDRERRRDNSRASYRDRDVEIERDAKLRDRDRKLEMDRERDRNIARDRYRDKTRDVESDRNRRYHKYDDRDDGYGNRDRRHGYEEYRRDRDRKHASEEDRVSKDDHLKPKADRVNRDDDDQKEYEERVDLELAEQEEDDPERIKEKSRRLREAILQKYKAQQSQHEAPRQTAKALNEEPEEEPSENLVATNADRENADVKTNGQSTSSMETSFDFGKQSETKADEKSTGAAGLGEGTPKSERSNDMFSDDIFGDSPAGVRKMGKGDGLPVERSGLHDNWDDPEGYYSFRFGEILDGRYEITAAHGKGVFSTVVRAKDLKAGTGDPEEVAIKIIRNNETMLKAGTEELVILKKLVGADPEDRRHCVRYLSHFKYRNHLCIVFESLHMNLREVLKKFGRNIGLKLTAVRAYAKQLFIALKHLKNCGVLHCDIKPDNMLVNDAKNVLKLCDFGNAMFAGKNEITPYLVSRFYRAPEIILGLSYDHPMDIWSVGCCLYELYTGKVLFPGATNNDMLRLHMELKGSFPKKMLRKGAFIEQHFDQDLNFLALEEDPVTKKTIRRQMVNIKPKDISTIIKGSPGEDPKMLANFKELLDKIFVLDPDKRLTVSQALSHPFITVEELASGIVQVGLRRLVFVGRSLTGSSQWNVFCFYCKATRQRRLSFVVTILDDDHAKKIH